MKLRVDFRKISAQYQFTGAIQNLKDSTHLQYNPYFIVNP